MSTFLHLIFTVALVVAATCGLVLLVEGFSARRRAHAKYLEALGRYAETRRSYVARQRERDAEREERDRLAKRVAEREQAERVAAQLNRMAPDIYAKRKRTPPRPRYSPGIPARPAPQNDDGSAHLLHAAVLGAMLADAPSKPAAPAIEPGGGTFGGGGASGAWDTKTVIDAGALEGGRYDPAPAEVSGSASASADASPSYSSDSGSSDSGSSGGGGE